MSHFEFDNPQENELHLLPHSLEQSDLNRFLAGLNPMQYELLSAYLDGELKATERRQVESWLDSDPKVKQCYHQLIKLRSQWQAMPIPATHSATPELAQAVFSKINRRTRRRVAWGGTAIAALFLATVSSVTNGSLLRMPQFAFKSYDDVEPLKIALNEPIVPIVNPEAASITVNQPIIPIPKAAVSIPEQ